MGLRYIIRTYSYGGAEKFFRVFIKGYLMQPFGMKPFSYFYTEGDAKDATLHIDKLATFEETV